MTGLDDHPALKRLAEIRKDLEELDRRLDGALSGLRATGFEEEMRTRMRWIETALTSLKRDGPDCGQFKEDYAKEHDAYRAAVRVYLGTIEDVYTPDLQQHLQPVDAKELKDLTARLDRLGRILKYVESSLEQDDSLVTSRTRDGLQHVRQAIGATAGKAHNLHVALDGRKNKAAALGDELERYVVAFRALQEPTHDWEESVIERPYPGPRDEPRIVEKKIRKCRKCGTEGSPEHGS